jgi:hypothetical protein
VSVSAPMAHASFPGVMTTRSSCGTRQQAAGAPQACTGHTSWVTSVGFSPDGARIVSGSLDRTIKLWDTTTGQELRTLTGRHTDPSFYPSSVGFSPDGDRVVSVSRGLDELTITLWDATTGQELHSLTGHAEEEVNVDTRTSFSFSPDGVRLYSQAGNERYVWDTATGERILNADWLPPESPRTTSPDGRWLVVPSGTDVLVVDRAFKNTPDEKAYRAFKAQPKPHWHAERAAESEDARDWFAATFHRAWQLKLSPDSRPAYDDFQRTHELFLSTSPANIPSIVAEASAIEKPADIPQDEQPPNDFLDPERMTISVSIRDAVQTFHKEDDGHYQLNQTRSVDSIVMVIDGNRFPVQEDEVDTDLPDRNMGEFHHVQLVRTADGQVFLDEVQRDKLDEAERVKLDEEFHDISTSTALEFLEGDWEAYQQGQRVVLQYTESGLMQLSAASSKLWAQAVRQLMLSPEDSATVEVTFEEFPNCEIEVYEGQIRISAQGAFKALCEVDRGNSQQAEE